MTAGCACPCRRRSPAITSAVMRLNWVGNPHPNPLPHKGGGTYLDSFSPLSSPSPLVGCPPTNGGIYGGTRGRGMGGEDDRSRILQTGTRPTAGRQSRRAAGLVARRQIRHVHPLGRLRHPGGRLAGRAYRRHRRVDHAARRDTGRGIRGAGASVQSGQVRCRPDRKAGEARRPEVHRAHVKAPRRLLHVRQRRDGLQHRRRHAFRAATSSRSWRRPARAKASSSACIIRRRKTGIIPTASAIPGISTRTSKTSALTSTTTSSRKCANS